MGVVHAGVVGVLETTVRDVSQGVLSERGLRPAGQPQMEVASFDTGKDLEYDMKIELLPEIDLVDPKSLSLERLKVVPSDKEVDDAIARIASQNRESRPVEEARPAEEGDHLVLDIPGQFEGDAKPEGTGVGKRGCRP